LESDIFTSLEKEGVHSEEERQSIMRPQPVKHEVKQEISNEDEEEEEEDVSVVPQVVSPEKEIYA
jgi:hypothetical protein